MSGGFTAVFLVLALLAEYLSRIMIEVRARPGFTVSRSSVLLPQAGEGSPSPPLAGLAQVWADPLDETAPRPDRKVQP
jgi:hypothetical protein